MSNTEVTQAPWHMSDVDGVYEVFAGGKAIAIMSGPSMGEECANATMMAASPDLLDVAELVLATFAIHDLEESSRNICSPTSGEGSHYQSERKHSVLETFIDALAWLYAIPCGHLGTPFCATNYSFTCSPIMCMLIPFAAIFLVAGVAAGIAEKIKSKFSQG